ncbi:MAG: serine hydrolase domain-containing protein [Micropepsaceae bacterium]
MRRFRLVAAAAAACWMTVAASADDAFAARVADRILDELVKVNRVPGMAASVWRDGAVVWTGAAGWADIEARKPVTADTVFRFASVSKLFAATAAARLREEGRLDTSAPVSTYLPWLTGKWPAISSEQLAAHTSGIPHYQTRDMGRGGVRFATQRDAVALFEGRTLLSKPGAAYEYSSWGYTLLGAVIEAVSGQPYLDYLAANLTPGLAIGFDATDSGNPDASLAYEIGRKGARRADPHDYSYSLGGAALGGTAPALATWGGRVLRGEVVKPETLAWMLTPARLNDASVVADDGYEVGFGWRAERTRDGARLAHHAGITTGARSVLVLMPDADMAASVLSNASWVSAIDDTAVMLAAGFGPASAAGEACPVDAASYQATMKDEAMSGSLGFVLEDGLCVGRIALDEDGALAEWLSDAGDTEVAQVTVVGLDSDGRFARGALVTPIGVYDLRRDGDVLSVIFNATRSLTVKLVR